MRKFKKKEKVYIAMTLVLFLTMVAKSVWFDPIKVEDKETEAIVTLVQEVIDETHTGFFYRTGIFMTRIIDVKPDGEMDFKGHYRKYFAGFFPIGDMYFSSKDARGAK